MIISYLVFGDNNTNYIQAFFSILTFLGKMNHEDRIIILTDSPGKFGFIKDRGTIHTLNDKQLKDWKGTQDFFWRIKIKALQYVVSKYPEQDLLYVDADTFLFGDLDAIRTKFREGHTLMHLNEGILRNIPAKTTKHMWRKMNGRNYGGAEINNESCMWNAGVVGIPDNHVDKLDLALIICDEMCLDIERKRLLEQFALSIALNESIQLHASDNEIGHYWGNKNQWNEMISDFICDCHLKSLTITEQVEEVKQLNFEEMPVNIRTSSSRKKLEKLLKRLLPDKKKEFISYLNSEKPL